VPWPFVLSQSVPGEGSASTPSVLAHTGDSAVVDPVADVIEMQRGQAVLEGDPQTTVIL
jgi:hypothetical protein